MTQHEIQPKKKTQSHFELTFSYNSSQPGLKQEEFTAAMLRNTWIRWEAIN
jgi:hypothetical protein